MYKKGINRLLSEEVQILQCVQQDVEELLTVCASIRASFDGRIISLSGGIWVSERQEVTEHHGQPITPAPFYTTELILPQTYSTLLP